MSQMLPLSLSGHLRCLHLPPQLPGHLQTKPQARLEQVNCTPHPLGGLVHPLLNRGFSQYGRITPRGALCRTKISQVLQLQLGIGRHCKSHLVAQPGQPIHVSRVARILRCSTGQIIAALLDPHQMSQHQPSLQASPLSNMFMNLDGKQAQRQQLKMQPVIKYGTVFKTCLCKISVVY